MNAINEVILERRHHTEGATLHEIQSFARRAAEESAWTAFLHHDQKGRTEGRVKWRTDYTMHRDSIRRLQWTSNTSLTTGSLGEVDTPIPRTRTKATYALVLDAKLPKGWYAVDVTYDFSVDPVSVAAADIKMKVLVRRAQLVDFVKEKTALAKELLAMGLAKAKGNIDEVKEKMTKKIRNLRLRLW